VALLPQFLKPVSDAIGDAFSTEEFEKIVKVATGDGLFEEFASPDDPRRRAVYRTLKQLMEAGTERWLLIGLLVSPVTDDGLRRLIVKSYPGLFGLLPKVDAQVDRARESLTQVKAAALKPEYLPALRESRERISAISDEIRRLSVFKDLHECLHALHLKLAFRSSAAADDRTLCGDIKQTGVTARSTATSLGATGADELSWITELDRCAAALEAAIGAADAAAAESAFEQTQRVIRLQLSRLNKLIFQAADELSLAGLIEVLPAEVKVEESFFGLAHAIRELKTTVMARALVHKLWQDAENELSVIEGVLAIPQNALQQFTAHWFGQRGLSSQVQWLASLDPEAEWSKLAQTYSDRIQTELSRETLDDQMKVPFGTLCRVLKLRFFEVDAMLKADCGSLGKLHDPLKAMVEDIGHG
jgi:hypothetical protein